MSTDTKAPQDPEPDECPICGQPYDHKRTERRGISSPVYRDDAKICKTLKIGGERQVYLHLPHLTEEAVERTSDQ